MINFAVNAFNLLSKGCTFLVSFKNLKNMSNHALERVDLEREVLRYNNGTALIDPSDSVEQNKLALQLDMMQLALFGYASYRLCMGEQSPEDLVIAYSATALTLYPQVKRGVQAALESAPVQSVTSRVFQKI